MGKIYIESIEYDPHPGIRDGKDRLCFNEETFNRSVEILRNNGLLLIFAEGLCEHQTTLLPLKKGAPRILLSYWQEGIAAQVLPVWLRYHLFFSFGEKSGNQFWKYIRERNIETWYCTGRSGKIDQ